MNKLINLVWCFNEHTELNTTIQIAEKIIEMHKEINKEVFEYDIEAFMQNALCENDKIYVFNEYNSN